MKPKNLKTLQENAKNLRATRINPHIIIVESKSNRLANHVVTLTHDSGGSIHARCTCPWAINGGVACSHVIAALEYLAERRGRRLSFWENRDSACRQKRRLFYLKGARPNGDDGVWITSRVA